jgi:hypothetical protein
LYKLKKRHTFAKTIKDMAKERLKVAVAAEEIAGQLRRDEKFSQGVRLYAVYQIALGKKAGSISF